jgi:hypothetical protein
MKRGCTSEALCETIRKSGKEYRREMGNKDDIASARQACHEVRLRCSASLADALEACREVARDMGLRLLRGDGLGLNYHDGFTPFPPTIAIDVEVTKEGEQLWLCVAGSPSRRGVPPARIEAMVDSFGARLEREMASAPVTERARRSRALRQRAVDVLAAISWLPWVLTPFVVVAALVSYARSVSWARWLWFALTVAWALGAAAYMFKGWLTGMRSPAGRAAEVLGLVICVAAIVVALALALRGG